MSLPSFLAGPSVNPASTVDVATLPRAGAGNHLPIWLLACCGSFTAVATAVSIMSITLQLKNYRKPMLQRAVVRIMVMVPLYAISSLIALFSLEAAFFIDTVRDLYEAFVIYVFFQLLVTYLGGERSLLILLHGRPPIQHPFPINLFLKPMDVSDPWTLLNLKREYVQVKPLLVVVTIILKVTGTYHEGKFAHDSGYTYISVVYNTSICLSLYCLAMFWVCVTHDLKPFRPVPKFLCVKGILFFSFWQAIFISLLVAWKAIKQVGPYRDAEHMSLALVDSMVCFEMPIFAIAHQYAFQANDYIDHSLAYAARLPFIYALRDAFGLKDVIQDTKATIKGRGVSYQAYEPAEGGLHYGEGRQKRIRAGLRYSKGGTAKYWLPIPGEEGRHRGDAGPVASIKRRFDERLAAREGYAPLLPQQAADVVHEDPDLEDEEDHHAHFGGMFESDSDESDAPSIGFESVDDDEEGMYDRARRIAYAGFPNIDVSNEEQKRRLWEEEEGILAGKWGRTGKGNEGRPGMGRGKSQDHGKAKGKQTKQSVYGAWADRLSNIGGVRSVRLVSPHSEEDGDGEDGEEDPSLLQRAKVKIQSELHNILEPPGLEEDGPKSPSTGEDEDDNGQPQRIADRDPPGRKLKPKLKSLPSDARDLVTEDSRAVEEVRAVERRRGEPQTKAPAHIFRHSSQTGMERAGEVEAVYSPDLDEERITSQAIEPGEEPLGDAVEQMERIEKIVTRPTRPDAPSRGGSVTSRSDDDNPWS